MRRTMGLGLVLIVATAGCGEDCEEPEGGQLFLRNAFNQAVELSYPNVLEPIVLPPGDSVWVTIPWDGLVVGRIAADPASASTQTDVYCCEKDCGAVVVWSHSVGILLEQEPPECPEYGPCDDPPPESGEGGGSCPYVFVFDGSDFVLSGEALVGALNRGAQRTDVFPLPRLQERDGVYSVRLAAVLRETDFIDRVSLKVVDHPVGTELVVGSEGNMVLTEDEVSATKATDSTGGDVLDAVIGEDARSWSGRNTSSTLRGNHRDWIEIDFPRPADPATAILVVRGRSSQWIQDSYHRYMAQFGGGADSALRLLSHLPGYGQAIDALMKQGAFGVDVELEAPTGWRSQGTLRAIGPAGMRTVALPLAEADLRDADPAHIRLRLSVLPGGWEIDSVRVAKIVPLTPEVQTVPPHRAALGRRGRSGEAVELAALGEIDGVSQAVVHTQQLTVDFDSPPRSDQKRTALLDVTGYYEEQPPSMLQRLWLQPFAVAESFVVAEHFTDFVVGELRQADGD